MRISVFGLGYVGSVTAACLADLGHHVVGVDIHPAKVEAMAAGKPPVLEDGLESTLSRVLASGHLTVTTDSIAAIEATEMSIIAVGTPSSNTGAVDLRSVQRCVESIAGVLRHSTDLHCIVIRSTVPSGTTEGMLEMAARLSGRVLGGKLLGGMNPEFLREGSAVHDFFEPGLIVIGADNEDSCEMIARIYEGIDGVKTHFVSTREAEMVKYVNNSFHALKITFANEVDRVCDQLRVDGGRIMGIVCDDTKLNISTKYLRPGFAFGGSCLPKDLRAINRLADVNGVKAPLLESLLRSNLFHINDALKRVISTGLQRVGVLGLTFKAGTDDIRESPSLALCAMLREAGVDLAIYDCNLEPSQLMGASRAYMDDEFPDIENVWMQSAAEVVEWAELVLLVNAEPAYVDALDGRDLQVLDLCKSGLDTISRLAEH